MSVAEFFDKYSDEYLKFDKIQNKVHPVPDICAFLMLHNLAPEINSIGTFSDMISYAAHEEIFLSTDVDKLFENATNDQLIDLIRCGVRYSEEHHCLCMFV